VAGEVIYDQVSFRYPGADADVLCDVSFVVQPGQTVAILGTTGAGKSTLVNLLPRFYDVTRGSVRTDGHDVRDVTLAIREALDRLIRARRRTVFVIAQRISTVRDADLILVLDDGGVAAQGRHADLVRDSELYNQILGSQLRDDSVDAAATIASEHPLTAALSEAQA
jgi:ABC-type multidrug transport system fused ATPase/permease subunit